MKPWQKIGIPGIGIGSLLFMVLGVSTHAAETSAKVLQKKALQSWSQGEKGLGDALHETQRKIFESEILGDAEFYIREVKQIMGGEVQVDPDRLLIRDSLAWFGEGPLMLNLIGTPQCLSCQKGLAEWRKVLAKRMEARGFKPEWPKAGTAVSWVSLVDFAKKRGVPTVLLLEVDERLGLADETSGGSTPSEERSVILRATLRLPLRTGVARIDQELKLFETDSVTDGIQRLMRGVAIDAGRRISESESSRVTRMEAMIRFSGIQDYPNASELREKLQQTLSSIATFEEKKWMHHAVSFQLVAHSGVGLETRESFVAEVKKRLQGIKLDRSGVLLNWEMENNE